MLELTRILEEARDGLPRAREQLSVALYEELRSMARREMENERRGHTLQPTALVHEAYMRLLPGQPEGYENRAHFFGAAASALRRVLVDHARKRARFKRGGDRLQVSLDAVEPMVPLEDGELLELDDALSALAEFAPTPARIVELRFFAGMTVDEVARVLKTSPSSVQRSWRVARAWLRGQLSSHGA